MRVFAIQLAAAVALTPMLAGADCDATRSTLSEELALRFEDDDPAVFKRRDRINTLFLTATPSCAKELYEELGAKDSGEGLSHEFHYALATPTRAKLRETLRSVFEGFDKLDQRIDDLVGGAAARDHLHCWVEGLRNKADSRVIQWSRICPQDEPGCPARTAPTDDQLAAAIHSVQDVEEAKPEELGLFTFVDAVVEAQLIGDHFDEAVSDLKQIREQAVEASRQAGAAGRAAHYAPIAEWLAARDDDSGSLLSCP